MIVLPPRPRETFLPREIVRIDLTYVGPMRTSPATAEVIQREIMEPSTIREIVEEINELTDVTDGGIRTGIRNRGEHATLVCRRESGDGIEVAVRYGGVVVGNTRPLEDQNYRVWKLVSRMVGRSPFGGA